MDSTYILSLERQAVLFQSQLTLDSLACVQEKAGFRLALVTANNDRTYLQRRASELATQNETLGANLDERTSQLETTKDELRQWKPKTKAGRVLRKVRNGLAVVGGVGVVLGGLLIAR